MKKGIYIVRYRVVGRWDQLISRTYPNLTSALNCVISAHARKAGDVSLNGVMVSKTEALGMTEKADIKESDAKVTQTIDMLMNR